MGNQIDVAKAEYGRVMAGRRVIRTSYRSVTADNVMEVLHKALSVHLLNRSDIEYLWRYYRGEQPILQRTKEVRPEICNKIVENRANEIVSFKVGYLCGEPIQYVSRIGAEDVVGKINLLNEMMFSEDKASQDQELVEWQMVCGTSYRLVLPSEVEEDSPFSLYTLDPRNTFVVYSNDIGRKPVMAVKYYEDDHSILHYSVYTDSHCYYIDGDILNLEQSKPHGLGMVPIFEYPANHARLGAFEIVLPLLDAINKIESNRLDAIEQFVQAYWKFIGCTIDEETIRRFQAMGAISIPPNEGGGNIDVDLIVKELNQVQTQTLKEDMYQSIVIICGLPNRNGGSSTSDTGAAVLLRDGWSDAEARAKASENLFKRAEKQMLRLVLRICRDKANLDLHLKDIDMKFTRRNYEAIQSKSQVLISMLGCSDIHPQLAFQTCGLFSDAESAYTMSMDWREKKRNLAMEIASADTENENEGQP